jgi:ribulose kinase
MSENPYAVVIGVDLGMLSGRAVVVRVRPDRCAEACPGGRESLLA